MCFRSTAIPYQSKRQWRWAFATGQPFARRWARETPGGEGRRYRRLPATKAEPAEAAQSGAGRKPMTPQERARHAALVRWGKKNPLMGRVMALREKRKGGGAAPSPAPPQTGDERTKFLAGLGLDANNAEALSELLGGLKDGEDIALNRQAAEALQALGLLTIRPGQEGESNLTVDLSGPGKRLATAVEKGDIAAGMRVVEAGNKRAERNKPKEPAAAAPTGALSKQKDAEKKPKGKGGGGGGGGGKDKEKQPTPDKAAARDAERAKATAAAVSAAGLKPADLDDLRAAAESGDVESARLRALGLVGEDGQTTDQGRRALRALERGDVRGYRAALQDVEAARGRAAERTARTQERDAARAAREKERADREADRERERADAEAQKLDDLADDFRRGRRGLSFAEQRRLIRAGRARLNGERFELKAESHTPPQAVQAAARRALRLREQAAPSNRGMTPVGLARARDLANGRPLSTATVRKMRAFFERHDKTRPDGDAAGSRWEQAWLGWGGDAGWRWSRGIAERSETKGDDAVGLTEEEMQPHRPSVLGMARERRRLQGRLTPQEFAMADALGLVPRGPDVERLALELSLLEIDA